MANTTKMLKRSQGTSSQARTPSRQINNTQEMASEIGGGKWAERYQTPQTWCARLTARDIYDRRMDTHVYTCHCDRVAVVLAGLQVLVGLNEVCEGYPYHKLVRVGRGARLLLSEDGLGTQLEVLLHGIQAGTHRQANRG